MILYVCSSRLVISAPDSRLMSFDSSSMDLGLRLANSLCEVGCVEIDVEIDVEILMFERNSSSHVSKRRNLSLGLHKSDFFVWPRLPESQSCRAPKVVKSVLSPPEDL